jgi:hypothetical protein
VRGILVVLVADVLRHLEADFERGAPIDDPRLRQHARVFDRDFHVHVAEVAPMELLDQVHLLRMRRAGEVVPRLLEEADGVHDQRVAFPVRTRIAVEGGFQILRVIAAVDEELTVHVRVALEEHQHEVGGREECGVIRRGSRWTAR